MFGSSWYKKRIEFSNGNHIHTKSFHNSSWNQSENTEGTVTGLEKFGISFAYTVRIFPCVISSRPFFHWSPNDSRTEVISDVRRTTFLHPVETEVFAAAEIGKAATRRSVLSAAFLWNEGTKLGPVASWRSDEGNLCDREELKWFRLFGQQNERTGTLQTITEMKTRSLEWANYSSRGKMASTVWPSHWRAPRGEDKRQAHGEEA